MLTFTVLLACVFISFAQNHGWNQNGLDYSWDNHDNGLEHNSIDNRWGYEDEINSFDNGFGHDGFSYTGVDNGWKLNGHQEGWSNDETSGTVIATVGSNKGGIITHGKDFGGYAPVYQKGYGGYEPIYQKGYGGYEPIYGKGYGGFVKKIGGYAPVYGKGFNGGYGKKFGGFGNFHGNRKGYGGYGNIHGRYGKMSGGYRKKYGGYSKRY